MTYGLVENLIKTFFLKLVILNHIDTQRPKKWVHCEVLLLK